MSQPNTLVLNTTANNVIPFPRVIETPTWINDRIHRFHPDYQCLLYLWCAQGYRRSSTNEQQTWWVYVEYRQRSGASAYQVFEFDHPNKAQHFLKSECIKRQYQDLCAKATSKRPIGISSRV